MNKKINFIFFFGLIAAGLTGSAAAYSSNATLADLKPFARDLGGLMGAGTNQTARVLGFGGFDLSVKTVMQFEPEKKDGILLQKHPVTLSGAQAEIGMPYRVDAFIRAGSSDNVGFVGAGLKYGLTQPQEKFQMMLVGAVNMATHKYFYAIHLAPALVVSMNYAVISPYFSIAADQTKLTLQNLTDTTLIGKTIWAFEPRASVGFKLKFLTYGYFTAGYTYTHGVELVNCSLGLRV